MANKTDKTPPFTTIAALLAVLLVVAAGLFFLQAKNSGSSSTAGLAAVSQRLPLAAAAALDGEEGGFDRLTAARGELGSLRRAALGEPGSAADWERLEASANAIIGRQASIEGVVAARDALEEHGDALLDGAESLLSVSGSTSVVQEFQRRAGRLDLALESLPLSGNRQALAADVLADLEYMRNVIDGLNGGSSSIDVAALDSGDRDAILAPLDAAFTDVAMRVRQGVQDITGLEGVDVDLDSMRMAAASLYGSVAAEESGGGLPGFLANPLLPLAVLGLAGLLLAALTVLHSKSSVYERTAREQVAQNERNQQAILRLLDELGSLADGDLTVEATVTEDITGAIADSINYAIEKLRELVATINQTSIMVDSAAKQTESTAVHMARAADNQSREIAAATESIVSMAGSIEEVSGNAERSSDVARHSVEVAHKGGEAVRRTIDGMNTIRETIQDTSKRIKRLGESSQEIGNIVELINDIAEQTNILALNASIQASMAGEAGRGFAVVADEVQRLAERSTNATKQIEVLVRTIQSDTNEAVVSMERSTTDVVGGALLAENAGAALDEIEQVSNQIANLVQNISSSARQQAGSAADVTRRTGKLKEIGEQTGKATTATAASISKLSVLASQLRQTVDGFTLPNAALDQNSLAQAPIPASAAPKGQSASTPQPAVVKGKAAG